jgi:predicted 3-demethylubiquinone-9 3-methyltransferase (glyoxalase superfamily)
MSGSADRRYIDVDGRDSTVNPCFLERCTMERITPFLWFDSQAEEAANFYISVFKKGSRILDISRYGEAGPGTPGSVMTVQFVLDGQNFIALNGGPEFKFTEAVSFTVNCESQAEVDAFWDKLSAGGEPGPCGWLKDKYGLSWQINPSALGRMLADPDRERANRVMAAMLRMQKIVIADLEAAYNSAG